MGRNKEPVALGVPQGSRANRCIQMGGRREESLTRSRGWEPTTRLPALSRPSAGGTSPTRPALVRPGLDPSPTPVLVSPETLPPGHTQTLRFTSCPGAFSPGKSRGTNHTERHHRLQGPRVCTGSAAGRGPCSAPG